MQREIVMASRGLGKSTYIAERVVQLQDDGHDLVVVIVPNAQHVNYWFTLMWESNIDPSRFMVMPEQMADTQLRGQYFALAGFDNIDMMRDWRRVLYTIEPGVRNDVYVTTERN